jgi:hypothetical protein
MSLRPTKERIVCALPKSVGDYLNPSNGGDAAKPLPLSLLPRPTVAIQRRILDELNNCLHTKISSSHQLFSIHKQPCLVSPCLLV